MNLPIGEYFEVFVRGLKSQLGGFFDVVSNTIDFAISSLERVLSLDPEVWYSSLSIFLIIGLLVHLLVRKRLSWRVSAPLAAVVFFALVASNFARRSVINETVTPEEATRVVAVIDDFKGVYAGVDDAAFIEEADRAMGRISSRFDSLGRERLKRDLIGDRSFERAMEIVTTAGEWAEAGDPTFASALEAARSTLHSYNPNRLSWYAWAVVMGMLVLLALACSGRGLALFTLIGMSLIQNMGFWAATTDTLALVLSATGFALLIGVPLGIAAAANKAVDHASKPILDFMQTMPAFVYLIPAVMLFGLGTVPGAMATLIFAMPPAVRLTSLGIRSVPTEVVEAAQSFGSTPMQLLFKAQLPIALPTILAGLNQTIMLSLSMVVIGGMIGAGGLGEVVLTGITQLKIGLGFESGLSVVILAIFLDRLTQSLGSYKT